jgi:hypothetical protein
LADKFLYAMEPPARQQISRQKKMTKQLTGKRDDTPFHAVVRAGNLKLVKEMVAENLGEAAELTVMLSKQNQSGETALYVASEYSHVDIVKELIKYYDTGLASLKARNGYDTFHIAAKQGDLGKYCFQFLKFLARIYKLDCGSCCLIVCSVTVMRRDSESSHGGRS